MDNAGVDVVAYPTWSNPPRLIGDTTSPDGNNSPTIAPHTGAPAITVPMGVNTAGKQFLHHVFVIGTLLRLALFSFQVLNVGAICVREVNVGGCLCAKMGGLYMHVTCQLAGGPADRTSFGCNTAFV